MWILLKLASLLVLFTSSSLCANHNDAQLDSNADNLNFIASASFDIANFHSSVCVLNGTLVVVYQGTELDKSSKRDKVSDNPGMLYDLFDIKADGNIKRLTNGETYGSGSAPYLFAHSPSNLLIEVHQVDDSGDSDLNYRLGRLGGNKINWTPSTPYVTRHSYNPSVAVSESGIVIEMHQVDSYLYYCLGYLNTTSNTIKWNSSNNNYCTPTNLGVQGSKPRVFITKSNSVVVVYIGESSTATRGLFYSIGKISELGNNTATIEWVVKAIKYENCVCAQAAVLVDPFGVITEVHKNDYNDTLFYKTGKLYDNYIEWNDSIPYNPGVDPVITFMNSTNYLYAEVHSSQGNAQLVTNTMGFDVSLVNITYGDPDQKDRVYIQTQTTDFSNNGPGTLTQGWTLSTEYTCTNTYSWNKNLHFGYSVSFTAGVSFLGIGASVTTKIDVGFDLSAGKSSSVSQSFKWTEEEQVEVPPRVGNVTYSAAIYSVPHIVPFTATLKRGDFIWTETGTVEVTHGGIFSSITST